MRIKKAKEGNIQVFQVDGKVDQILNTKDGNKSIVEEKVIIEKSPAEELPKDIKPPIRLCRINAKMTPSAMRQILRSLDITVPTYLKRVNLKSLDQDIELNPTWSLRAWEILIIENLEWFRCLKSWPLLKVLMQE
ncbi:hypothetical protein HYZ97_02395 [Candidatus Pacearchaeota archaeon]|nr:hypothetical protein [Candidatus Pacearchaeota archaeon]